MSHEGNLSFQNTGCFSCTTLNTINFMLTIKENLKVCSNEANMLVQHHPTLLDATCWPRLNSILDDVGWSLNLLKICVQDYPLCTVVLHCRWYTICILYFVILPCQMQVDFIIIHQRKMMSYESVVTSTNVYCLPVLPLRNQ